MAHGIREWKTKFVQTTHAAAGRKDNKAWEWIVKAFDVKVTFEELGKVPDRFMSLDICTITFLYVPPISCRGRRGEKGGNPLPRSSSVSLIRG